MPRLVRNAAAVLVAVLALMLPANSVAQQLNPGVYVLAFSPSRTPYDSLPLRQALASAINREAVARAVPAAFGPRPAHRFVHPDIPDYYDRNLSGYPFDPAAAKRYFDQVDPGKRVETITIVVRSPDDPALANLQPLHLPLYNAVKASLEETLGIKVDIQYAENFRVFQQQFIRGDIPVYMIGWARRGGVDPPGAFMLSFLGGLIYVQQDREIAGAIAGRDAAKAEELVLRKALIVPVIYTRHPF